MSNNRAWQQAQLAARTEDTAWMAETGATVAEVAMRYGISSDGVEAWCRDNGQHATLERLRGNAGGGRVRQGRVGLVMV
jgi:hypothetical protein